MEVKPSGDEILTSREARLLLKIGRTKLWELTRTGKIPAYRVGDGKTSDLRYKRSELLKWLDAHVVIGTTR
mgnify:CR=1 FL=1